MLRSLKDLEGYQLSATDGDIGRVTNFLLDDEHWTVRYLVAETGGFLGGRRVLISPISFRQAEWSTRRFHVALTIDKVKNSPNVDVDKPVSRQHEQDYYRYYGYPYYWGYSGVWGMGAYPGPLATSIWTPPPVEPPGKAGDVHLRSAAEVRLYNIQGNDGPIGHIEDFIVDDETWEVRYLAIDTSNWWFGKKVLVAPHWASSVSWEERKVHLDLSRQAIKNSPEWNAAAAINRGYEARLYDYYGRPVYWDSGERPVGALPSHPSASHPL
ncbi:MAG TPA: PRC-barrel domain-containing protein [Planctomycetota bacterium]|nr:PRC-barrel domain-containing protein [Planctomycetota bacterium]